MNNVISLAPPAGTSRLPADFAGHLRDLADRCDRGEVDAALVIYIADDQYQFLRPSNLRDNLVMATLAKRRAVDSFLESE
jgi:hypothetical protein